MLCYLATTALALLAATSSVAAIAIQRDGHKPSNSSHGAVSGDASTFWYEQITHNGISPFIDNGANWKVYRNVKDYGAQGDGSSDDSSAIQAAINDGGRGPGGNGLGTTGAPAVVYFPSGTYRMGKSIQIYVDTVLMGNAGARPTLQASSGFSDGALVYGKDPAMDATINFYQGMKNLVLDSTKVDAGSSILLLDWSVSQATQLTNILFQMPDNSQHVGVSTPEGGSGTYMGNLDFVGGGVCINHNNQQYSIKGVTFNGCNTAVKIQHGFDVVLQDLTISNCGTGIDASGGGDGNVGSVTLIDSQATSVGTVVKTKAQNGSGDDSIVIDNLQVTSVGATVSAGGSTILSGSVSGTWVYGDAYLPSGRTGAGNSKQYQVTKDSSLLQGGKFFTMAPPTYADVSVSNIVNIKSVEGHQVHGDGVTDDTASINAILSQNAAASKVTFFPAGTYLVTSTIDIPPGSRLIGEAWSAISASGSFFQDESNPQPMVRLGKAGDVGVGQMSDMLLTVADVLPGCTLLEVNMAGSAPGDVGLWNTHFRVGGAAGSGVQTKCGNLCQAAFLLLHLKPTSSIYIEDMWGWTADHDLDGNNGQTISTGRGALVESHGPTWLVGTAFEHNTLYQYNFANASRLFSGMQQSETPYWQGKGGPATAPAPWTPNPGYGDPTFDNCNGDADCAMAWYQIISGGSDIHLYGTGFWTFFNANGGCSGQDGTCQNNAGLIQNSPQRLSWWNHNTRGVENLVIDDGKALATQQSDPGSWGGVVAAILTHSGL